MFRSLLALSRSRRELGRLSDRMLRDIGIEPSAIREPARPSALIMQPALLRLRDPEPEAAGPPAPRLRRAPDTNALRVPAARPI
jgi:hypothetical protein